MNERVGRLFPGFAMPGMAGQPVELPLTEADRDYLQLIQARAAVAQRYPVLLTGLTATSADTYTRSRRIPWPFAITEILSSITINTGTARNTRASLRVTNVQTEDSAAWTEGFSVWGHFSEDEEWHGDVDINPTGLWIPFWEKDLSLIMKYRTTDAAVQATWALCITITPLEEVFGGVAM